MVYRTTRNARAVCRAFPRFRRLHHYSGAYMGRKPVAYICDIRNAPEA